MPSRSTSRRSCPDSSECVLRCENLPDGPSRLRPQATSTSRPPTPEKSQRQGHFTALLRRITRAAKTAICTTKKPFHRAIRIEKLCLPSRLLCPQPKRDEDSGHDEARKSPVEWATIFPSDLHSDCGSHKARRSSRRSAVCDTNTVCRLDRNSESGQTSPSQIHTLTTPMPGFLPGAVSRRHCTTMKHSKPYAQ